MPLQPYFVNVQPAIRSLDIEPSKTAIKSGESIEFSITLESTIDLTIIFDCGISDIPLTIIYIEQTSDLSSISIGNCTYSIAGQYHPLVSTMNRINSINRSINIDVEPPLSPFKIEIEDRLDINQLTLITIQALEQITFEGLFTLTIIDYFNEKNQTKIENVQLLKSNNFTEQIYMNITTYGRQVLHVRGGDFPTIREAQVTFTIGTEITTKPQVYIMNSTGLVNEDFIWIDIQWINGIGFDIQIDYGKQSKVLLRYEQFISNSLNRIMKKNDVQWKRIAKQRLQVGFK
jgi:hypothetical protein